MVAVSDKNEQDQLMSYIRKKLLAYTQNGMSPDRAMQEVATEMPAWAGKMIEESSAKMFRPGMINFVESGMLNGRRVDWMIYDESAIDPRAKSNSSAEALTEAMQKIKELEEVLERVKKEPLMLQRIDRITKDKKHCFVKKGDMDLRIEAAKDMKSGDEVLLHPKTFQIVEHLGRPPLEVSPFSPATIPNVTWADIGGLEQAKADMIEAIELPHTNRELFAHYKKRQIKGILLAGPPGCGKTMLGKAAANALPRIYSKEAARTGFLYVKGPEILNMFVGATEQTIRDMFFDAQRHREEHGYPAVIFIDEADAILAKRGGRSFGMQNTIVPMFLTEMDGLQESGAIVIIATNRPDTLDPAIVRDGRIDRKVTVTRPDKVNGKLILKMNLERMPLGKGVDIDTMLDELIESFYHPDRYARGEVRMSDVVNGAMLANLADIMASFAIKRDIASGKKTGITAEDGISAIEMVQAQEGMIKHDLDE